MNKKSQIRLINGLVIGIILIGILGLYFVGAAGLTPIPVGSVNDSDGANSLDGALGIYVSDGYAYILGSIDDTLSVWNVTNSTQKINPEPVGSVTDDDGDYSIDNAYAVFVVDDYAYTVSSNDDTFAIWNISEHGDPVPLGSVTDDIGDYSLNGARDIFVLDGYAYITSYIDDTLSVWNVTNSTQKVNPEPVGTVNDSDGANSLDAVWGVYVDGGYAYTASWSDSTISVWNISDYGDPVPLGSVHDNAGDYNTFFVRDVVVNGSYLYTNSHDTFSVWDISGHGNPAPIGTYTANTGDYSVAYGRAITIVDDFAYVVSSDHDNLVMFDISNPTNPFPVGAYTDSEGDYSLDNVANIFGNGSYVYTISQLDDTFAIFDITSRLDINVDHPISTYAYFNDISLNYTIINYSTLDTCIYRVDYANIPGILIGNTTIAGCINTTFNLFAGDNDFNLTLYVNNSLGTLVEETTIFYIRTTSPAIILDSPMDNQYFDNSTKRYFNFTATDASEGLSECQLWLNHTGTWHNNYTWTSPTNATMNWTTLNITQGDAKYKYNVWCNDTLDNSDWSISNYSFTIDETYPNITMNSISTSVGSQTITFNSTEQDINIDECFYSVFNSTGGIDGTNENVSYSCGVGQEHTATITDYGSYNLTIYVNDLAGNENSTKEEYTITAATTSNGGSGGSITVIGFNSTWSVTTDTGGTVYDFIMSENAKRKRAIIYKNLGDFPINLNITCEDVLGELCEYLTFDQTFLIIEPLDTKEINFELNLTDKVENAVYDINVVAEEQGDQSRGVLRIRARVGSYSILSWIIQRFIGKQTLTLFEEDYEIYNFFILIMPFIILGPLFYYVIFSKLKIKFPLTFIIMFLLTIIIMFLL